MKKIPVLSIVLLLAAAAAGFASAETSFDAGVDASAALRQARDAAKTDKSVSVPLSAGMRYDVDCAAIRFTSSDSTVSGRVHLRSQGWDYRCQPSPDPRHGGPNCGEVPGMSYWRDARITLQNRPVLLPGQQENFSVCLEGEDLSVEVVKSVYDYKVVSIDSDKGEIVLTAAKKTQN